MDIVDFHEFRKHLADGCIFYDDTPSTEKLNFYVKKNGLQIFVTEQSPIEVVVLMDGHIADKRIYPEGNLGRNYALTYIINMVKTYERNLRGI